MSPNLVRSGFVVLSCTTVPDSLTSLPPLSLESTSDSLVSQHAPPSTEHSTSRLRSCWMGCRMVPFCIHRCTQHTWPSLLGLSSITTPMHHCNLGTWCSSTRTTDPSFKSFPPPIWLLPVGRLAKYSWLQCNQNILASSETNACLSCRSSPHTFPGSQWAPEFSPLPCKKWFLEVPRILYYMQKLSSFRCFRW